MKEFSQKINIIPVADAPETIEPPFTGFDEFHSYVEINPSCKNEQTSAGSYYKFELRITQHEPDSSLIEKYKNKKPSILVLFDTDGNNYVVGNSETPVRAIINPVQLSYEIIFTATLLKSPF